LYSSSVVKAAPELKSIAPESEVLFEFLNEGEDPTVHSLDSEARLDLEAFALSELRKWEATFPPSPLAIKIVLTIFARPFSRKEY
jgi:hypothetical protein